MATVGALVSHALVRRYPPRPDLVASNHWPEPLTAGPVDHDRGPVVVLVTYRIARENRTPFLQTVSNADADLQGDVSKFHIGLGAPLVEHLLNLEVRTSH